jgi:hypothetical protein
MIHHELATVVSMRCFDDNVLAACRAVCMLKKRMEVGNIILTLSSCSICEFPHLACLHLLGMLMHATLRKAHFTPQAL